MGGKENGSYCSGFRVVGKWKQFKVIQETWEILHRDPT